MFGVGGGAFVMRWGVVMSARRCCGEKGSGRSSTWGASRQAAVGGKFLTLWDTWLTLCKVCCTLCRMDATLIAKPTNLVRKLRRWRELSQAELAERAHVSRQTIVNVEKGSYSPSVYLALAICRELGATVEEVFGDEQSMEVVKGETS